MGNENCSTAIDLGSPALPTSIDASLDSTPEAADLDFYRFSAPPGSTVTIEVSGLGSMTGTTSYPLIGLFDASCALYQESYRYGVAQVVAAVPADGSITLAVTVSDDWSYAGGGVGGYQLRIRAFESFSGVSGQLVDATTGLPDPNLAWWNSAVYLFRCSDIGCGELTYANATTVDVDGYFTMTHDWMGSPLEAGTYQVQIYAVDYASQTLQFTAAAGSSIDLGAIALSPIPRINSISGRVLDAETLDLPSLPYWWYGYASLIRCNDVACTDFQWVGWTYLDPSNGRFTFTRTYWGAPLEVGTYRVFVQAPDYLPFESAPVAGNDGDDVDMGDLLIHPVPRIDSISGRIVDSRNGSPVAGAYVYLQGGCDYSWSCAYVSAAVDANGNFRFDTDEYGDRLRAGTYWIAAYADQYQPHYSGFEARTANEDVNLGDIALVSNPIRFTDVQTCNDIPSSGGRCRFSVKLVNGQAGVVGGTAWAEIEAWGLGSFVGYSRYTLAKQGVAFAAGSQGSSKTLSFVLDVPGNVQDYAYFCSTIWFGEGSNPYLNTTGSRYLFCIQKGAYGGFNLVTESEARALKKKMAEEAAAPKLEPKRMHPNRPAPEHMPRGLPGAPR